MLISLPSPGSPCLLESWESEINPTISEQMKCKVIDYVHSIAIDAKIKEINYKLLTKRYYVPAKLHKLEGTHAHIWLHCPLIKVFWREILKMIKKFSGVEIRQDPWQCLFHTTGGVWEKYRSSGSVFVKCSKSLNSETMETKENSGPYSE